MSGKFREYSTVVMMDDKASIPVGPVGAPVGATRRQRHVYCKETDEINSTDHDIVAQHITPSVSILLEPPADPGSKKWYGGVPEVILKCAIFEPSNAFRHSAELFNRIKLEMEDVTPLLFGITDGGPDHNTMHVSTQLALIALFLALDLDFLCFARTPPNFSVINPVERFMCVANIALNGVALAREPVGEHERLVKNLCSKSAWREAVSKHPNIAIKSLAKEGISHAITMIEQRLSRLSYKGNEIKIGNPASDEDIENMKHELLLLFPGQKLDFDHLSKTGIMKQDTFKHFYTEHVRETQYCIQIKKCMDLKCTFHSWVRTPEATFSSLFWLPSPQLGLNGNYKTFEESYGTEPTDKDRPGNICHNSKVPKPTWQLQPTRARKIICCSECFFPRIVYSKIQLSKKDLIKLDAHFEENPFICGDHVSYQEVGIQEVFLHEKTYCYAQVSAQYYQLDFLPGYKLICAICLNEDIPPTEDRQPKCDKCMDKMKTQNKTKSKK